MNRRAQQFMPFAALKGYYKLIEEKENDFEAKKELSEDRINNLNDKLSRLKIGDKISLKYYHLNKYKTIKGILIDIDMSKRCLFVDKEQIFINDIYEVFQIA